MLDTRRNVGKTLKNGNKVTKWGLSKKFNDPLGTLQNYEETLKNRNDNSIDSINLK